MSLSDQPPASLRQIAEWYQTPQKHRAEDYYTIQKLRAKKSAVRAGIDSYSGLKGPLLRSVMEGWFKDCKVARLMIKATMKEKLSDEIERASSIKSYKVKHGRIIRSIRGLRFSADQWTPTCSAPFYFEPNTKYVPEECVQKARFSGVNFTRVDMPSLTHAMFLRIEKRLREAVRMNSFWASTFEDEVDDDGVRHQQCFFLFSDPEDRAKLDEELVWVRMRF